MSDATAITLEDKAPSSDSFELAMEVTASMANGLYEAAHKHQSDGPDEITFKWPVFLTNGTARVRLPCDTTQLEDSTEAREIAGTMSLSVPTIFYAASDGIFCQVAERLFELNADNDMRAAVDERNKFLLPLTHKT